MQKRPPDITYIYTTHVDVMNWHRFRVLDRVLTAQEHHGVGKCKDLVNVPCMTCIAMKHGTAEEKAKYAD